MGWALVVLATMEMGARHAGDKGVGARCVGDKGVALVVLATRGLDARAGDEVRGVGRGLGGLPILYRVSLLSMKKSN